MIAPSRKSKFIRLTDKKGPINDFSNIAGIMLAP